MTTQQMKQLVSTEPFRPFRVTLRSGEKFEIKRTLRAVISDQLSAFALNDDPVTGIASETRYVHTSEIASVEPIDS